MLKKVYKSRPAVPRAWSPNLEREQRESTDEPQVIVVEEDNVFQRPSLAEEAPETAFTRHSTSPKHDRTASSRSSNRSAGSVSLVSATEGKPALQPTRFVQDAGKRAAVSPVRKAASVEGAKEKKHIGVINRLKFWKKPKLEDGSERKPRTPTPSPTARESLDSGSPKSSSTAGRSRQLQSGGSIGGRSQSGLEPTRSQSRSTAAGKVSSSPRSDADRLETTSVGGTSGRSQKRKAHKTKSLSSVPGVIGRRNNRSKADPSIDDDSRISPAGSAASSVVNTALRKMTTDRTDGKENKSKLQSGVTEQTEKTPLIASTSGQFRYRGEKALQGWWARFNEPPARRRRIKPLVCAALLGCFILGALYCSTVNAYEMQNESLYGFACSNSSSIAENKARTNRNDKDVSVVGKGNEKMEKNERNGKGLDKENGKEETSKTLGEKKGRHQRAVETKNERRQEEKKAEDQEHKKAEEKKGENETMNGDLSKNDTVAESGDEKKQRKNADEPTEKRGNKTDTMNHLNDDVPAEKNDKEPSKRGNENEETGKNELRAPGSSVNRRNVRRRRIRGNEQCNETMLEENLTDVQYGFIEHAAPAMVAILAPILGALTEFTPRLFLLVGLFLLGVAYIGYGCIYLATSVMTFVRVSIFLRLVQALGTSAFAVAVFAILAAECHGNMAMVTAMALGFVTAGFTLGPVIYFGFLQVSSEYDISGWILGGLAVVLSIICCPCVNPISGRHTEKWLGRSPSMFSSILLWFLALTTVVCGLSVSFYACRLFRTVSEVTKESIYISVIIAGFVVVLLITLFIFGAMMIVRKAAAWAFTLFGLCLTAAGYFVAGPLPLFEFRQYLWTVGVSAGVLAVGFGMTLSTLYSGMLDAANKVGRPESLKLNAHVSGLFVGSLFTGVFLASIITDYAVPNLGWRWTTSVIACINVSMVLLGAVYKGWKVFIRKRRHFDDEYSAASAVPPLVPYGSITGRGSMGHMDEQKQIM